MPQKLTLLSTPPILVDGRNHRLENGKLATSTAVMDLQWKNIPPGFVGSVLVPAASRHLI